jgi:hypothetical protein
MLPSPGRREGKRGGPGRVQGREGLGTKGREEVLSKHEGVDVRGRKKDI